MLPVTPQLLKMLNNKLIHSTSAARPLFGWQGIYVFTFLFAFSLGCFHFNAQASAYFDNSHIACEKKGLLCFHDTDFNWIKWFSYFLFYHKFQRTVHRRQCTQLVTMQTLKMKTKWSQNTVKMIFKQNMLGYGPVIRSRDSLDFLSYSFHSN